MSQKVHFSFELVLFLSNVFCFLKVSFPFKGVCSGVVRGSGRQTVGMVINFISYCCCGLPLGIVLMFLVSHDVTGSKQECLLNSSTYINYIVGTSLELLQVQTNGVGAFPLLLFPVIQSLCR